MMNKVLRSGSESISFLDSFKAELTDAVHDNKGIYIAFNCACFGSVSGSAKMSKAYVETDSRGKACCHFEVSGLHFHFYCENVSYEADNDRWIIKDGFCSVKIFFR